MNASDLHRILSRLREEVAHLDRISIDAGLTEQERLAVQSNHVVGTRDLRALLKGIDTLRSSLEEEKKIARAYSSLFHDVERTMQYQAANERTSDDEAYDYLGLCWAALRDKIAEAGEPESLPDVEVAVPAKALGFALAMVTSLADALHGPHIRCLGCEEQYERDQIVEHVSSCDKHPLGVELQRLTRELAAARAVMADMRRYLPTPGETPGETRISVREWEPLMRRIEAIAGPTPEAESRDV